MFKPKLQIVTFPVTNILNEGRVEIDYSRSPAIGLTHRIRGQREGRGGREPRGVEPLVVALFYAIRKTAASNAVGTSGGRNKVDEPRLVWSCNHDWRSPLQHSDATELPIPQDGARDSVLQEGRPFPAGRS